jgi:hypothetical protein
MILRRIAFADIARTRFDPIDEPTRNGAASILADVRFDGEAAVRKHAERLGDVKAGEPLLLDAKALAKALASLPNEDRECAAANTGSGCSYATCARCTTSASGRRPLQRAC